MKIQVTAGHIRDGMPYRATRCPVALALKSAGFASATVSGVMITVGQGEDEPQTVIKPVPPVVIAFIRNYDDLGPDHVVPFEFELVLPAVAP